MILYILTVFAVFFLLFLYLPALRIEGIPKWVMPLAFTVKVLVGLYFLFIYSVYYGEGELTADAGKFMKESKMLQEVFFQSKEAYFRFLFGIGDSPELINTYLSETTHWDPGTQAVISDNRNILRVHSLIHFISFNKPSIHVIILSFFSMIGLKQLFLVFRKYSQWNNRVLFFALLILPSALFWTSSILKEPLMLLGTGLFIRATLYPDPVRKRITLGIIGMLMMIGFKSYVLFALIPVLIFYLLTRLIPKWKIAASLILLGLVIGMTLLFMTDQRQDLVRRMSRKQYDFISVAKGGIHAYADSLFYYFSADQFPLLSVSNDSVQVDQDLTAETLHLGDISNPGKVELKASAKKWPIYFMNEQCDGYLELTPIDNSFAQLIKNIPEALINSLIRPFPNDSGKWLKFPAMVEIWILWIIIAYAVFKRRALNFEQQKLITGSILFIVIMALVIGWVTPVLGAIVRYRIPILLAMLLIAAIISEPPLKYKRHE